MVRRPEYTIHQHPRLPLQCSRCDHREERTERTWDLDQALVVAGHLRELAAEWALLVRLRALLERVPNWENRWVSSSEAMRAPELQEGFARDPELATHVGRSSFHLVPRMRFVEGAVRDLDQSLPRDLLRCPCCTEGPLQLEPEFFARL